MKKIIVALLGFLFCFCSYAYAAEVQATWEYANQPSDLVGFTLYADEQEVWTGNDPNQRLCNFELPLPGPLVIFTITAYDATNESVPSAGYPLDPPPPAVTSLTVSE